MKRDRWIEQIANIIKEAKTQYELEDMKQAVIEARALVEAKLYALKQAEFKAKMGRNI